MIFRRNTNEIQQLKTTGAAKRSAANNGRMAQTEPRLNSSSAYAASSSSASAQGSSMSSNSGNSSSSQPPVSPIAMAQSRRTNGSSAAASFSRQEQLRKLTVGRDITLNGEITTCDHLIVEGTVTATIKGGQILEVMESGTFNGVVDIEQADIAGQFDGDLIVRGKLVLRPTARVSGTVHYRSLQVDAGATLNGQIGMLPPVSDGHMNGVEMPHTPVRGSDQGMYNLAAVNDQPGFLKA